MRAQLVPVDGTPSIEIVKDLTVVGRQEDCDLCLKHKSVSKLHCVIVRTDGLLLLRDLGSTNGTRVNGQRVRRAALLPNDQLSIASYKFRVSLSPDEPPAVLEEHTQPLDAKEIANLFRKADPQGEKVPHQPLPLPVQPNVLPDVYPEERSSKS